MNLILLNPTLKAFDTAANMKTAEDLIASRRSQILSDDIVLLPEGIIFDEDRDSYRSHIVKLAEFAGCTVVGGSHHERVGNKYLNTGCVIGPKGSDVGEYTKLRPYFAEQNRVTPGTKLGEIRINGRDFLILICADFWYSDLILNASSLPDAILVPSLSVSRKPVADYSRSLWRNLIISRAYEFGVFVGISDWGAQSILSKYRTCGVGGFADPSIVEPDQIFAPVSGDGISTFPLDFERLNLFREDRKLRGFFWKKQRSRF